MYASCGAGHRRAAEAIYNYLRQNQPTTQTKIINALDYTPSLFHRIYSGGYTFLIKYLPWLWRIFFEVSANRFLYPFIKRVSCLLNYLVSARLRHLLLAYNPQAVIATHFFPLETVSFLKKRMGLNLRIVAVVTDFNVHPFWLFNEIDDYRVACARAQEQLINFNVPGYRIETSGIPIDSIFLQTENKSALCRKLAIQEDKFTALIVTGTIGIGPIEKIVDLLASDIQVLAICGRNQRLYKRLKAKRYQLLRVYRLVRNIQELMRVSDVIITKAGGLTISEALVMQLPLVFIANIPGQETANAKALKKLGAGFIPQNLQDLRKIVLGFRNNRCRLNQIKEKVRSISKPFAAREIIDAVCKG
jgi:processive 1,2-diacylglycerol beta-glucosyltransferase